jgi:aryl-phospho-beta-D-glucosidase BglC (GH1 family)
VQEPRYDLGPMRTTPQTKFEEVFYSRISTAPRFIYFTRTFTDKLFCVVNLGGWGVLEPWITPSIFENLNQSLGIVDEYTLCEKLGTAEASGILFGHWASFYT